MPEKYDALLTRLKQIEDLNAASSLLNWDLEVMMPEEGNKARARQLATHSRVLHHMRTSDETGRLLEEAEKEMAGAPYDSDEAAMVRIARYDFDQNTKLPAASCLR